jgi:hypothetical protein
MKGERQMIVGLVWAGLRAHPLSSAFVVVCLVAWAALSGVPPWAPLLGWVVLNLVIVEMWFVIEPVWLRLRRCRPATADERARLGSPKFAAYVVEEDALRIEPGLKSLIVSRGAMEVLDNVCLAALAVQAQAASEPGRVLILVGAGPILALGLVTRAIGRVGLLLAVSAGAALVVPPWAWGESFARVAGRVLGAVLLVILAFELLASGLVTLGLGLLTAWALVPCLQWLLGWEARRLEVHADAVAARAGVGWQLLEALENLRSLGQPVATRMERLQQALRLV